MVLHARYIAEYFFISYSYFGFTEASSIVINKHTLTSQLMFWRMVLLVEWTVWTIFVLKKVDKWLKRSYKYICWLSWWLWWWWWKLMFMLLRSTHVFMKIVIYTLNFFNGYYKANLIFFDHHYKNFLFKTKYSKKLVWYISNLCSSISETWIWVCNDLNAWRTMNDTLR